MTLLIWILAYLAVALGSPVSNKESNIKESLSGYKDQYCTDPRTMRKHAAYTEWADAYSCTRHRCQPGGRNLAIYTVGCKRVEAPESAIECEEVVEDTNMQFPFCCTRLRCLVVVRGEVWTRVLGQPWEVLPAAPWSHMYKMKKPPPTDTPFQSKMNEQGPVYELTDAESDSDKPHEGSRASRASQKAATTSPDYSQMVQRADPSPAAAPDIVIALSTSNDKEPIKKSETARQQDTSIMWRASSHDSDTEPETKHTRKNLVKSKRLVEKEEYSDRHESDLQDLDDQVSTTEKSVETSEEKFNGKKTHKNQHSQPSWTEIPQNQWNEHEGMEADPKVNEPAHQQEIQPQEIEKIEKKEEKTEKSGNLQALVDAIGSRMKDIENVVQRMSEKVQQTKSPGAMNSEKRFSVRNRGSKYLEIPTDMGSTELPNIEDSNYFSDASNSVRRSSVHQPKESVPSHPTYMAPVETQHKPVHIATVSDTSEDQERKKKKHSHKRKKSKTHAHKKHHIQEKRKHFNKLSSHEVDKNVVSLEDSSAIKD